MTNIMAIIKNQGPSEEDLVRKFLVKHQDKEMIRKWNFEQDIKETGQLPLFPPELNLQPESLDISESFPRLDTKIGVVVADGLASGDRETTPGNQKVFPIGNNYVLGTGHGTHIDFSARDLIEFKDLPPKHLAAKLFEVMDSLVSGEGRPSYIVIGPGEADLEIYEVVPNLLKRAVGPSNQTYDGSGAEFVNKARHRDAMKGLNEKMNPLTTIADITAYLFDLAHVATKSSGVNDELQFGFLTPYGNATLLHPHVNALFPTKEYNDENQQFDMKKAETNNNFYWDFITKLGRIFGLNKSYNQLSTEMRCDSGMHYEQLSERFEKMQMTLVETRLLKDEINHMIHSYVSAHNSEPEKPESGSSPGVISKLKTMLGYQPTSKQ